MTTNIVQISATGKQRANGARRFDRVLVINPPSPPGFVANRDSQGGYGQLYPPGANIPIALDIPYLLAYLAKFDVPLEVIESQGMDLDMSGMAKKAAEIISAAAPERVLAVVRIALCCLDWDLSACAAIRKAAPTARIAIYGPIIPEIQKRIEQESALDYYIQGEPDATVYELASGRDEQEIAGLSYRQGVSWEHSVSRPLKKELDELPFPKWDLLPYHRYTLPRSSTTSAVFLPMLTSRGCPFGCHYCPYPRQPGSALPFPFAAKCRGRNRIPGKELTCRICTVPRPDVLPSPGSRGRDLQRDPAPRPLGSVEM